MALPAIHVHTTHALHTQGVCSDWKLSFFILIVQNVACNSLIIMDELGRGTSNEEGLGICHAVCEYLIHHKVCCLGLCALFIEFCQPSFHSVLHSLQHTF